MVNTKSNALFKALQPGEWELIDGALYYKNAEVRSSCLSFPSELENYFEEFKMEFQDNELEPNSEKYITCKINHFTARLKELELYQKQQTDFFNRVDSENPEPTGEELKKHIKDLYTSDFRLLEYIIKCQIRICSDVIDYINQSKTLNEGVEKNISPAVTDTKKEENSVLPAQMVSSEYKGTYNGSKIDLIIFFYALHCGNVFSFKKRKCFESFIENNCKSMKASEEKDITGVLNEMSEILNCVKEHDSIDKKGVTKWKLKKRNVISAIITSLKNTVDRLEDIRENTDIPPKDGSDGWRKKR